MKSQARYFDLTDDMRIPGRWHLKSPVDTRGQKIDPWQFDKGKPVRLEEVPIIPVSRPGKALDFSLTGLAIPVVHARVASLFERLGLLEDAQFIPARVEGLSEPYFILNALKIIRCIDDARCDEVLYWTPEDGEPDRVGEYQNVRGLKVDPTKVGNADIFRPWGWTVVLIVSERVKRALEEKGVTGTRFTEV
ncbi:imm11 family protein [Archangium sp.]|uniref:imm11 family protein n=1 Tax=Archangium sp. TaxID=1872627 RepID=UPI002D2C4402|nr:DUF1629 domain-containing protein [Archangium sp.]HYO58313.1 DUF1629 domain-containing protein [Archangium sp.]